MIKVDTEYTFHDPLEDSKILASQIKNGNQSCNG
jgi:hypothetical protein